VNAHGYLRFTKNADFVIQLIPGQYQADLCRARCTWLYTGGTSHG
jgi:hypothetical protein